MSVVTYMIFESPMNRHCPSCGALLAWRLMKGKFAFENNELPLMQRNFTVKSSCPECGTFIEKNHHYLTRSAQNLFVIIICSSPFLKASFKIPLPFMGMVYIGSIFLYLVYMQWHLRNWPLWKLSENGTNKSFKG